MTLYTIIKHTEKVLPVLESFKWPLTSVPPADKIGTLIKYEVGKKIADKLISINDLDDKYNIYFDNDKIKNSFLFDVNNYDFVFYYAKIGKQDNYYVPSNYVYLNSKTNIKPQNSQYNLGIVISENKDNNIQTSDNINLFDLITHNIDWKFNNQIINFIAPVKSLSYNNFVTGKAIIYNEQQLGNYTSFYIDKGNIIHILSKEDNNELLKLKRNENYQLVNIDDSSNTYIPSMLIFNIGFDVTLVKLLNKNYMNILINTDLVNAIGYFSGAYGTVASAIITDYKYVKNGAMNYSSQPLYIFFPNARLTNKFLRSRDNNSYLINLKFVEIGIMSNQPNKTIIYCITDEMYNSGNFNEMDIITLKKQ